MAERMDVIYNLPEEVRKASRISIGYLIKLLPGWVTKLHVDFETNPDENSHGTVAEMRAEYRYREVYLTIFPRLLWESEQSRKEKIVHEAVHVLNAPIQNMVNAAIEGVLKDNETAKALFIAQWAIANESATEDTARAILASAGWGPVELEPEDEELDEEEPPAVRTTEIVKPFEAPADGG